MTTPPGIANFVAQTSISVGTGNLSMNTVLGRQSFAAAFGVSTDDTFFYFVSNPNAGEWEVGIGHLSDASTLVRDEVLSSSNSDDPVSFSSGTKSVVNDLPAQYQNVLLQPGYRLKVDIGAVTLLSSDKIVEINKTVPATTVVNVDPAALVVGKYYTIKLSKDDAITNEVTIVPATGNFDGQATYVLSYPWQSITFFSNGTNLRGIA